MYVLLLGATGNLGLRMIPALLAHGHTVVAFIRSESKLQSLITPRLFNSITIHIGDALDTDSVENALHQHGCDALMNTAGNFAPPWKGQYLGKIATAVSSAAVRVGRERGKVLRAWFIGGLGSLVYPYEGNAEGWKGEDFLPRWGHEHHRGTAVALQKVSTDDLEWTLLCVGWMLPVSKVVDVWAGPRGHGLLVEADVMPEWQSSWLGRVPVVGRVLDLFWWVSDYATKLEDVADMVAEEMSRREGRFVGRLVGMKDVKKKKKTA